MRFVIEKYIDKITDSDILMFARNNDIELNAKEISILQFYLKNNWEDLLYGDPIPIINRLKEDFDKSKCEAITNLFYLYKEKYKDYL